jgi:hypothetical protein
VQAEVRDLQVQRVGNPFIERSRQHWKGANRSIIIVAAKKPLNPCLLFSDGSVHIKKTGLDLQDADGRKKKQ